MINTIRQPRVAALIRSVASENSSNTAVERVLNLVGAKPLSLAASAARSGKRDSLASDGGACDLIRQRVPSIEQRRRHAAREREQANALSDRLSPSVNSELERQLQQQLGSSSMLEHRRNLDAYMGIHNPRDTSSKISRQMPIDLAGSSPLKVSQMITDTHLHSRRVTQEHIDQMRSKWIVGANAAFSLSLQLLVLPLSKVLISACFNLW